ncbi:MAG: hypothetical protein M0Z43_04470 [Acidithiobacillus sp.]|nr:hypothetical protein [Acidithiobacillus sp.]
MKKLIARHGDVYVFSIDQIPETAKKINSRVLAEGEVTGHAHRLTGEVDVYEDTDGTLYLVPTDTTTIEHEEHTEIPSRVLPDHDHAAIRIQREWNPYRRAAERVRD